MKPLPPKPMAKKPKAPSSSSSQTPSLPGGDLFEQLMQEAEAIIKRIEDGEITEPEEIEAQMDRVYQNLEKCNLIVEELKVEVERMEQEFGSEDAQGASPAKKAAKMPNALNES